MCECYSTWPPVDHCWTALAESWRCYSGSALTCAMIPPRGKQKTRCEFQLEQQHATIVRKNPSLARIEVQEGKEAHMDRAETRHNQRCFNRNTRYTPQNEMERAEPTQIKKSRNQEHKKTNQGQPTKVNQPRPTNQPSNSKTKHVTAPCACGGGRFSQPSSAASRSRDALAPVLHAPP